MRFIDGKFVQRAVASKGLDGDWEDHGFSTSYFILPVAFYVRFLIQLRQMCSWRIFCNPCAITTLFRFFWLKNHGLFNHYLGPFNHHRSPYTPAVNKMPSFCAMEKRIWYIIFWTTQLPIWNGDVFNQRFVISPKTGILHACLSPKRQNLTTLASGEKRLFVSYSLKGLQFWSDYMGD